MVWLIYVTVVIGRTRAFAHAVWSAGHLNHSDGKAAAETDYSGMHISMCSTPRRASGLKAIATTSTDTTPAALAANKKLRELGFDQAKASNLLEAVKHKHKPIAHHFGSDDGVRLMRNRGNLKSSAHAGQQSGDDAFEPEPIADDVPGIHQLKVTYAVQVSIDKPSILMSNK